MVVAMLEKQMLHISSPGPFSVRLLSTFHASGSGSHCFVKETGEYRVVVVDV